MPARSRKAGDEPEPGPGPETDPAAAGEPDPAGDPVPLTAEEQAAIRDRLRRKYH